MVTMKDSSNLQGREDTRRKNQPKDGPMAAHTKWQ